MRQLGALVACINFFSGAECLGSQCAACGKLRLGVRQVALPNFYR